MGCLRNRQLGWSHEISVFTFGPFLARIYVPQLKVRILAYDSGQYFSPSLFAIIFLLFINPSRSVSSFQKKIKKEGKWGEEEVERLAYSPVNMYTHKLTPCMQMTKFFWILSLMEQLLPIIISFHLGSWSDTYGRIPFIAINMIGKVVQYKKNPPNLKLVIPKWGSFLR